MHSGLSFLTFKAKKEMWSVTRLTSSILLCFEDSRDTWLFLWKRISPLASSREDSISQWPTSGATSLQSSFCPQRTSTFNTRGSSGTPCWKRRELTNLEVCTPQANWKESRECPAQEVNSVWGDSRKASPISKDSCDKTQGSLWKLDELVKFRKSWI